MLRAVGGHQGAVAVGQGWLERQSFLEATRDDRRVTEREARRNQWRQEAGNKGPTGGSGGSQGLAR